MIERHQVRARIKQLIAKVDSTLDKDAFSYGPTLTPPPEVDKPFPIRHRHTGRQRYTKEQIFEMREMARAGEDAAAISARFGISKGYLSQILHANARAAV